MWFLVSKSRLNGIISEVLHQPSRPIPTPPSWVPPLHGLLVDHLKNLICVHMNEVIVKDFNKSGHVNLTKSIVFFVLWIQQLLIKVQVLIWTLQDPFALCSWSSWVLWFCRPEQPSAVLPASWGGCCFSGPPRITVGKKPTMALSTFCLTGDEPFQLSALSPQSFLPEHSSLRWGVNV